MSLEKLVFIWLWLILAHPESIDANGIPNQNPVGLSPFSNNVPAGGATSPGGPSSPYGIPEERGLVDTFTMATVNHTYYDGLDELFRLMDENNAKFGEGKIFPVHGKLVHVTAVKDVNDHTACHPEITGSRGQRYVISQI